MNVSCVSSFAPCKGHTAVGCSSRQYGRFVLNGRHHTYGCLRSRSAFSRRLCRSPATLLGWEGANSSAVARSASDTDAAASSSCETDIWQPVPPTPALGRTRKAAMLIGCAVLEVALTGGLLWSPLLGAIAVVLLQPTEAEIAARQDEAVQKAVVSTRIQMARQLPVTPVESAAWLDRLNQEMWSSFWEPFLLANNLGMWQDTVRAAAPKGWEAEIVDVSIGTFAPQVSNFQALADPSTGALGAIDCHMVFDSRNARLVVVGRGPLGAFTARVSGVQMEGDLRIIPLLQHRLLLVGFKEQPRVRVSLSLSAPLFKTALSPGDLGQLNFIQELLGAAIKDMLVEPRRMAISLDTDIRVEEAVATTLHLTVESINGLPKSVLSPAAAASDGPGGSSSRGGRPLPARKTNRAGAGSGIALVAVDMTSRVSRSTGAASPIAMRRAVLLRQGLSLELPRKEGIFRLEARDTSKGGKRTVLGSCQLWVAAGRDGTTLFWSHDRDGAPLATRWSPTDAPWRITLPMTGAVSGSKGLEVSLAVAVEPWVYRQPLAGSRSHRHAGPRVVVLQVVEAHGLSLPPSSNSWVPATHIEVCYDQECYITSTQYGGGSLIYNELFAIQENNSMLTRRVKLETWLDAPPQQQERAATPGSSSGGKSFGSSNSLGRRGFAPIGRRSMGMRGGRDGSSNSSSNGGRLHHPNRVSGYGSSNSNGSNGGSGNASQVPSHPLPYAALTTHSSDWLHGDDSHMQVDVELDENSTAEGTEGVQQGNGYGSSNSSSSGGSISLGSTILNLDQLTEDVIQDRWYFLTDGGKVRLRIALVPGTLGGGSSSSSSKRRSRKAANDTNSPLDGDKVSSMLSFFQRSLLNSSRESLLVEVMSARLFLPLSSLDSEDSDQPAYMLKYGESSTITLPPYLQPSLCRPRPKPRSSSSSNKKRYSSESKVHSGSSSASSNNNSNWLYEDIAPGNVSQQITGNYCLARCFFSLAEPANQTTAIGVPGYSSSTYLLSDGSSSNQVVAANVESYIAATTDAGDAAALAVGPKLQVLLYDADDLLDASPATVAAAAAAAGVAVRPSSSSFTGSSSGCASIPEDIGKAEIVVSKLLQAVAGPGNAAGGGPNGVNAIHGSGGSGEGAGSSGADGVLPAAAATASWEGWVRLDKDGGHLLIRLTQLPASEPADLVPPPLSYAASSTGTSGGTGSAAAAADTAAAAVLASVRTAAGGSGNEEGSGGFTSKISHFFGKAFQQAETQAAGVHGQLSDATTAAKDWWSSGSSSIGSWISNSIPTWGKRDSDNNSNDGSSSSTDGSSTKEWKQQGPGRGASHASSSNASQHHHRYEGQQIDEGGQQPFLLQQQRGKQHDSHQPSSIDLRHIVKAWGWGGGHDKEKDEQHYSSSKELEQVDGSSSRAKSSSRHQGGDKNSEQDKPSGMSGLLAALSSVISYPHHSSNGSGSGSNGNNNGKAKPSAQQQHQADEDKKLQQQEQKQELYRQQYDWQQQQQRQQQQQNAAVRRRTSLLHDDAGDSITHSCSNGNDSTSREAAASDSSGNGTKFSSNAHQQQPERPQERARHDSCNGCGGSSSKVMADISSAHNRCTGSDRQASGPCQERNNSTDGTARSADAQGDSSSVNHRNDAADTLVSLEITSSADGVSVTQTAGPHQPATTHQAPPGSGSGTGQTEQAQHAESGVSKPLHAVQYNQRPGGAHPGAHNEDEEF